MRADEALREEVRRSIPRQSTRATGRDAGRATCRAAGGARGRARRRSAAGWPTGRSPAPTAWAPAPPCRRARRPAPAPPTCPARPGSPAAPPGPTSAPRCGARARVSYGCGLSHEYILLVTTRKHYTIL